MNPTYVVEVEPRERALVRLESTSPELIAEMLKLFTRFDAVRMWVDGHTFAGCDAILVTHEEVRRMLRDARKHAFQKGM